MTDILIKPSSLTHWVANSFSTLSFSAIISGYFFYIGPLQRLISRDVSFWFYFVAIAELESLFVDLLKDFEGVGEGMFYFIFLFGAFILDSFKTWLLVIELIESKAPFDKTPVGDFVKTFTGPGPLKEFLTNLQK